MDENFYQDAFTAMGSMDGDLPPELRYSLPDHATESMPDDLPNASAESDSFTNQQYGAPAGASIDPRAQDNSSIADTAEAAFLDTSHHSTLGSFPQVSTLNLSGHHKRLMASNVSAFSSASASADDDFDVELDRLLLLLPEEMRRRVSEHGEVYELIEVVMDLGRKPLARFPSGDFVISDYPITVQDIEHATSQVS